MIGLRKTIVWASRLRFPFRYSLLKFAGLAIAGIILLVALQAGNNRIFDRHFPETRVVNVPSGLDPR